MKGSFSTCVEYVWCFKVDSSSDDDGCNCNCNWDFSCSCSFTLLFVDLFFPFVVAIVGSGSL